MKQTKHFLLSIFLSFIFLDSAAQYDFDGYSETILIDNITEGKFTVYDTTRYKVPIVKSEKEIDWSKIEHVAISKLYANTREWAMKVYEDTTDRARDKLYYERIKNITPDGEYITPLCSYNYKVENQEAAFMVFVWHSKLTDGVGIPLTLDVIKKNGRWLEPAMGNSLILFGISAVFFEFREQVLYQLFKGEMTDNELINDLIKKIKRDNVLSIEALFKELVRIKENEESEEYKILTRRQYLGDLPKINFNSDRTIQTKMVSQPMELFDCKRYKYENYEYSINGKIVNKKWVSELAILNSNKKNTTDTLRFLQRITFTSFGKPVSIIKYKIGKSIKADVLELVNNQWKITNNPRFENIRLCLQYIKIKNWGDFFRNEYYQKDPVIKQFTPLYIQKMHNWNLDRLGEILKNKPKELAPYCDFD